LLGFAASAFCSGSEAVLMSIDINRAKQIIDEGAKKGGAMKFMVEHPAELLTTILVGNNIANIYLASLMTILTVRFFGHDVIAVSVGLSTFLVLIFGEITPKTFARTHSEALAVPAIRSLQVMYYILYPIVRFMTFIIHKILGENAVLRGRIVTRNDIEYMVNKAEKEKTMDSKQIELLSSILEFPTIKIKDIMVQRTKIAWIPLDATFDQILDMVAKDSFSRYPVCTNDIDGMEGFLHVKDLAKVVRERLTTFRLEDYLKESFFVYEHMKIQAVFDHMKKKKIHMALVKDENGLVVGLVTLEDIIEEILGEINDEHDAEDHPQEESNIHKVSDDGLVVEGTTSLRNLYNEYDIKIPLNDNYSTLSGFILDMLGNNFPEQGQIIVWDGYSFELREVEDFEIKKILIRDVDGEKHFYSRTESSEEISDKVESPA
jgi:putative hemolysin